MRLSEAIGLHLSQYQPETIISRKRYLDWLVIYLKDKNIVSLRITDFLSFQFQLQVKDSVKKYIAISLRSLVSYLNDNFDANLDANKIKIPKCVVGSYKRISTDDFNRLCRSIDTSTIYGIRNLAICKALYDTGCRRSEFLSLMIEQLGEEMEIEGAKKGGRRMVFLTKPTLKSINKYLNLRTDDLPFLFISHGRWGKVTQFTPKSFKNLITKLGENIGIKTHPHQFRKALLTDLAYKSGGNLSMVKEVAGHKKISTTEGYVKYDKLQVKKFYQKYRNDCEELDFSQKKNGNITLELHGWSKKSYAKKMRSAINKAINDVLE